MIAVIMAGGVGSRFWPRSRVKRPKQLLDIVSDDSMLRVTFDRLKYVTDPGRIYVVAGPDLADAIKTDLPEMPEDNLIIEPSGKNTAPAIGLVAVMLRAQYQDEVMGVFSADHLIEDVEAFARDVRSGEEFAKQNDALITFGIQPDQPATGYGYIQIDPDKPLARQHIFRVSRFAEKPGLETAKQMVVSGEYLWNSGMFMWRTASILKAIKNHMPVLSEVLHTIGDSVSDEDFLSILKHNWGAIKGESIDYGVMEQAENVFVISASFDWNDVGSWDALYDLSEKDPAGNVLQGDIQIIDVENCLVHSKDLRIAAVGLKDLLIIKSGDALLIVNRRESQRVKEIVNALKANQEIKYL